MKPLHAAKQHWEDLFIGGIAPHEIALGFALGTFIALLPTFGFSVLLGLLLIFLFPNTNRPAVFLSLAVWNPIVQIPIYAASFYVGTMLFGNMPVVQYDLELLNQAYTFTRRFLVGHLLISTLLTIVAYITAYITMRQFINLSPSEER